MAFNVNSLLIGSSWTEFRGVGSPVISYSFPTESIAFSTSSELTFGQKSAVKLALEAWSKVCGIKFVEVPSNGTIQFAKDDLGGNLGLSSYPASSFLPVFFSNKVTSRFQRCSNPPA